ncbi:hypothetical protein [Lactococcus lactis]|uniref:hypothetical protein n=1 Tax=Lactococcus lactis TaxID=1358 RepID=UPI0022E2BD5C|nr:hypothetical protein [Lactococcus lactis]
MKLNKKIKALFIQSGEVSKDLPEEIEEWILNKYISSNGWDCSGSAFAGIDTFVVWVDLNSENTAKEKFDFSDLDSISKLFEANNLKKNWIFFDYSVTTHLSIN